MNRVKKKAAPEKRKLSLEDYKVSFKGTQKQLEKPVGSHQITEIGPEPVQPSHLASREGTKRPKKEKRAPSTIYFGSVEKRMLNELYADCILSDQKAVKSDVVCKAIRQYYEQMKASN